MGMQQMQVTVTGNLGAEPVSFGKDLDSPACSFRVGVTPRYFDAREGAWKDRETSWVGVRAYRTLAVNVLGSLHKGDPVIVTGTLHTERWRKEGVDRITPVVEASAVGCDLSQGTCRFRRVGREQPALSPSGEVQSSDGAAGVQTGADATPGIASAVIPGTMSEAASGITADGGAGTVGGAAAVPASGAAGTMAAPADGAATGNVPAFLADAGGAPGGAAAPGPSGPAAGEASDGFDGAEF